LNSFSPLGVLNFYIRLCVLLQLYYITYEYSYCFIFISIKSCAWIFICNHKITGYLFLGACNNSLWDFCKGLFGNTRWFWMRSWKFKPINYFQTLSHSSPCFFFQISRIHQKFCSRIRVYFSLSHIQLMFPCRDCSTVNRFLICYFYISKHFTLYG
jgi:hypothetical protein